MPISLLFFLVALVLLALQAFPVTGVVLMLLPTAYLSLVLIALGFVGLTTEVVLGRISVLWLAVPALYLVGYYGVYWQQRVTLAELSRQFDAQNARNGESIRFDPDTMALVFPFGQDHQFLYQFDIPAVYTVARGDRPYRFHFLAPKAMISTLEDDGVLDRHLASFSQMKMFGPKVAGARSDPALCHVFLPTPPKDPAVYVTTQRETFRKGRLSVTQVTYTLTGSDGAERTLVSGVADLLGPLPVLATVGWLDSSTPKWRVAPVVGQRSKAVVGQATGNDLLAEALGLSAVDPLTREGSDETTVRHWIAEAWLAQESLLDGMIADPGGEEPAFDKGLFLNRPALFQPRSGEMVQAVLTWPPDGKRGRNYLFLTQLIAALPEPEFALHAQALHETLVVKPNRYRADKSLTDRLQAEVGAKP